MDSEGYDFGAADLPAACVAAPFIGQRLFWVAQTNRSGFRGQGCCKNASQKIALRGQVGQRERIRIDPWASHDVVVCSDGRTRRAKPGTRMLVDGFSGRVELLRGYGNAIVPACAAAFVQAYMEDAQ
jgi:DNA (cytosine-5)-methyltransferase 1